MEASRKIELETIATKCRADALAMVRSAHSGHLGGSLSVMDLLTVLYFDVMNIDPEKPHDPHRDRCVLSKGHCTPAMYSILSRRGYFPRAWLSNFRQIDSVLSGHVEMTKVPGVDMSAGSLGQGLSAGLGMALASRVDGGKYRVYAICGDGEIQEGQIWEAAQAASHYAVDNLTVFIDNNGIQLDGFTEQIGGASNAAAKFSAFGWHTTEIDGHDMESIEKALEETRSISGKPSVIVANTVKGKGISFMENNPKWHGNVPTEDEFEIAFKELDDRLAELGASWEGWAR